MSKSCSPKDECWTALKNVIVAINLEEFEVNYVAAPQQVEGSGDCGVCVIQKN